MNKSILIIAAAALTLVGCGTADNSQKKEESKIENVQVIRLEPRQISREVEYSTTLEGYEQMNVSPSVQGNIEHIYVEPGTRVAKGQLLVRLDQTQLNAAKVQHNRLAVDLARTEALLKTGNVAQSVYDQLKSQFDASQENLKFLQKNTFVIAPFAGIITAKNYEDGEMYSPTKPILQLAQIARLKAHINIPESYFPRVKQNMQLNVVSDIYPDKNFKGRIEIVYPTIDPTTHTFTVKIDIPNPSLLLRPGMFAHTTLSLGKVDAIVVPYQAVLKQQGSNERYVFVKRGDTAHRISVTLGQRFDDMTEIESKELRNDDELVVVGQARLVDGVKVQIADNSPQTTDNKGAKDSVKTK